MGDKLMVVIMVGLVVLFIWCLIFVGVSFHGASECLKYGWSDSKVDFNLTVYCTRLVNFGNLGVI